MRVASTVYRANKWPHNSGLTMPEPRWNSGEGGARNASGLSLFATIWETWLESGSPLELLEGKESNYLGKNKTRHPTEVRSVLLYVRTDEA